MQAFITEELMWALHRERVEDARRVWLASRVAHKRGDDKPPSNGHPRRPSLNLRPAGGR